MSATVVLTAAHCADGQGEVLVTFDQYIGDGPELDYPRAADPSSGYTDADVADFKTASGGHVLSGTPTAHPEYSYFTDADNWNDVGVVVLDEPVEGIDPAPIASVGTLDAIGKNKLSKTLFRVVGYGFEVRKADGGPQKPTPMAFPLQRRYVDVKGQKLTDQILQSNGSTTNGKGTGAPCFGDSGGPVFLDGQVVAVTSYANNNSGNCRGVSGYQRVDIAGVQDWLATFGVTPAA